MIWLILVLVAVNTILLLQFYFAFKIEQRRSRILQAFIAGIVRSVSDYSSDTDEFYRAPARADRLLIPYRHILESVKYEFSKDFWAEPFDRWLRNDRLLFCDSTYGNDGFPAMYLDLFDELKNERTTGQPSLTEKEKAYLNEDVVVTKENIDELRGEIGMFKDLGSGELETESFQSTDVGSRLLVMFRHIRKDHRDKLRQLILERNQRS